MKAEEVISRLRLEELTIEGGYFNETYRSAARDAGGNSCGTCIYYMLRGADCSDWHKVANDEIWLYHCGTPAIQLLLFPDGRWEERIIGADLCGGQVPQSIIPAGSWQAAVLLDRAESSWGLFGAVVVPAFTYEGFTSGNGRELCSAYPGAASRIRELKLG